jgi:hypothetical protein
MARKLLQAAIWVALFAAIAALASCGGGGGGGEGMPPPVQGGGGGAPAPAPLVALSAANAQDAAGAGMLEGLGASSLSTLLDGASAQSASAAAPALPRTHVVTGFIKQQIDRLIRQPQAPSGVRVAASVAPPVCTTGSATVVDNGPDSVTETFNACSPDPGVSLSGTITISNMIVDPGVSFSGSVTINLLLKQTHFDDVTFTASNVAVVETINVDVGTFTLSGQSQAGQDIFITAGTVSERLSNFTFKASFSNNTETDEVTFNFASTKIGGSVNISTDTPCVTDATRNFPSTGVLSFAGTGGSKVRVTINGDETLATPQLKIELDADGDGTFESSSDRNWADLAV